MPVNPPELSNELYASGPGLLGFSGILQTYYWTHMENQHGLAAIVGMHNLDCMAHKGSECAGGILEDLSDTLVAVIIPEGAHHLDLMFSHPDDPPSVTEAREKEVAQMKRWLATGDTHSASRSVMLEEAVTESRVLELLPSRLQSWLQA